jgi:NADPH:quinone reductase
MKAVFYARFGGPEVLKIGELADPVPGPGQVLMRVRAAAINPVDWKIASGAFKSIFPYAFPIIPGWDAAGEVAGLGPDVTGFTLGEHVHAYTRRDTVQWGCYAQYVCVDAAVLARTPAGMSAVQAAAIPLVGLTAWQSLIAFADLQPGQTVLIPAAVGGVGSLAVPLAKWRGARVIATCGTANIAAAKALGADAVIDYRRDDMVAAVRALAPDGVDLLLDPLGGPGQAALVGLVRHGGAVAALNEPVPEEIAAAHGVRAARIFSSGDGAQLEQVSKLIAAGLLPLPHIETLPLDRAAEAFQRSIDGHVRGKLVLTVP